MPLRAGQFVRKILDWQDLSALLAQPLSVRLDSAERVLQRGRGDRRIGTRFLFAPKGSSRNPHRFSLGGDRPSCKPSPIPYGSIQLCLA